MSVQGFDVESATGPSNDRIHGESFNSRREVRFGEGAPVYRKSIVRRAAAGVPEFGIFRRKGRFEAALVDRFHVGFKG